jgi:hypothetical protein
MIRSNVNPLTLPRLFFAGRAVLTFFNPVTDKHITIKVKQARDKKDRKVRLPIFFVNISLLGDKEQGMVFAGTVFKDTMTYKMGKQVNPTSHLAQVFRWLCKVVVDPTLLRSQGVTLLHEGRCCRCGLPLTNPQSIERGLGDDCYSYTTQLETPATI